MEIAPATGSADKALRVGEQLPNQAVEESVQVTADQEGTTAVIGSGGYEHLRLPLEEVLVGEQVTIQALQQSDDVTSYSTLID